MIVLTILDGWGLGEQTDGNALAVAATPNYDKIEQKYPSTTLEASGEAVGLPEGQMGNSEVGHLNMGAGRVVYQDITRINLAVRDGSFFENPVFQEAMKAAAAGNALHLMGLVSDGGVHSHQEHLYALLEMAKKKGLEEVYIHAFLDGRDVPPKSAVKYLEQLENNCREIGVGKIATVTGRYYAMDRDQRWERVEKAYRAMVCGEGEKAGSAVRAVENSYQRDNTDEFVLPTVITDEEGQPTANVRSGDALIFFNFRADRARQITRAFVDEEFAGFTRSKDFPQLSSFVCMTEYAATIKAPVAFPPEELVNTLGEVLAKNNIPQIRIAETEKYAHVTFFFNGGVEEANPGEERILIPSPKVATYDLKPEMSAPQVTAKVVEAVESGKYPVIVVNYANPDMVGHTGKMDAAIRAVETVDGCLGQLFEAVRKMGASWLVTADHGNAEKMKDEQGKPHTAHTNNRVPFILVDDTMIKVKLKEGALKDVAPTILKLLKVEKPAEMIGENLIV